MLTGSTQQVGSTYCFQNGKLKKTFCCVKQKALVMWKAHFCRTIFSNGIG